jgi:hypothetical protein
MATAVTSKAPKASQRTDNDRRMFGYLREIRAACQYLQDFLDDTLKRASAMDAESRSVYLAKELAVAVRMRVDQKIEPQLNAIRALFEIDVTEFEWCADNITRIELTWAHVKDIWPAGGEEFVQLNRILEQIGSELDAIVYECVTLTFSPAVNDLMGNLRIGQPLDIEFEFGKNLPKDTELRKRLLQELAQEPVVLECGVVDADQGVIYKVAASRAGQLRSAWRIAGVLLLGFAIPVLLAGGGHVLTGWPLSFADLERLLVDYVLIFIGAGAHLAVAALQAAKNNTRPNFQALNDWVLWLHIREGQIIKGIFYIWAGYILLVVGVPKLDWDSAFFAGYSIDSITELFLERLQTVVKTKTDALSALAR